MKKQNWPFLALSNSKKFAWWDNKADMIEELFSDLSDGEQPDNEEIETALKHYFHKNNRIIENYSPFTFYEPDCLIRLITYTIKLTDLKVKTHQVSKNVLLEINGNIVKQLPFENYPTLLVEFSKTYHTNEKNIQAVSINTQLDAIVPAYHALNPINKLETAKSKMRAAMSDNTHNISIDEIGKAYLKYILEQKSSGVDKMYWCAFSTFIEEKRFLQLEPVEDESVGKEALEIFTQFEETKSKN